MSAENYISLCHHFHLTMKVKEVAKSKTNNMKTKPYYILRPFPENKVEAIQCNDSMKETKKCLPHFLSQSS